MLSKSLDPAPAYSELPVNSLPTGRERRRRSRATVHWPLNFFQPGSPQTLQTVTHNLSSEGFYCLVDGTFAPGETRQCTLTVPADRPQNGSRGLTLQCTVRIVRVELPGNDGVFGIGCRIEDYRLSATDGFLEP